MGDRLLLVVHGEVIAGVALGGVLSGDVTVAGDKVSIRLPAAEVFTTNLDNSKTRVYSRETGLLSSTDPFLESEVRQEAVRQLTEEAALQDGILKTAADNGCDDRGAIAWIGFSRRRRSIGSRSASRAGRQRSGETFLSVFATIRTVSLVCFSMSARLRVLIGCATTFSR